MTDEWYFGSVYKELSGGNNAYAAIARKDSSSTDVILFFVFKNNNAISDERVKAVTLPAAIAK